MKAWHRVVAAITGKNTASTPVTVIRDQMLEPRPLPMGRKEFEEWSDRLISGALIPGANARSQKKMLAEMVMHANPAESHLPDAYFIHRLRNGAAREVCFTIMKEIQAEQTADALKAQEEAKKAQEAKTLEAQPLT